MSFSIILIFGVALWHFLYEGILAPSRRFKVRLELFSLRDDIRTRLVDDCDAANDPAFLKIHDSINTAISLCSSISPGLFVEVQRALDSDPELRAEIEQRQVEIDACPIRGASDFRKNLSKQVHNALMANIGGWSILVIPPIIAFVAAKQAWVEICKLIVIPESELRSRGFLHDNDTLRYA